MHDAEFFVISEVDNAFLQKMSTKVFKGQTDDPDFVCRVAREVDADLVVIGPEEPLAAAVVDALESSGIPCVGPKKELAKIEWSKSFARKLVAKHAPELNPEFRVFTDMTGVEEYVRELGECVVKPDGLTGGKGVKIVGEQLSDHKAAVAYCETLLRDTGLPVVIEERLDGEEFSLQSFTDGITTVPTVVVQDHKRAYEGDSGPNTGGMGSYSCADHSLPFLSAECITAAEQANRKVIEALRAEIGAPYKGVLYGNYMRTRTGIKLVEYNARFADPEVMNILPILENDFLEVCWAIANQSLDKLSIKFKPKATVCKYIVPEGYPDNPIRNAELKIPEDLWSNPSLKIYVGAFNTDTSGHHIMTGSRAVAFVGIGDNLEEAEGIAEEAARSVKGSVFHRSDIGTPSLIQKRIDHMEKVLMQEIKSAA